MENSNIRRLTTHKKVNFDGEELQILIIWEEGCGKEIIKKENKYSKTQELLVSRGKSYEFIKKA
jgi:hypothetical protein